MMEKDIFRDLINKDYQQEIASEDFTQDTMQKVKHAMENKPSYKPLIPKKVGWIIALCYSLFFILPIVIGIPEQSLNFLDTVVFEGFDLRMLFEKMKLIFTLVFILSTLTLVDILSRRRKQTAII